MRKECSAIKKAKTIAIVMLLCFLLSGCSCKVIYTAEGMTIYLLEQEQGKEAYADMSIFPIKMPEGVKESLTAGEPLREYEVQLSDGTYTGFLEAENAKPCRYPWLYKSISEIADVLHMDILVSDMTIYPESNRNILLVYSDRERTVSIRGVRPKLERDYKISDMYIYLCFGPQTDHVRYSLREITEEVQYEAYEIAGGEKAHLLYDLAVKKAVIIVRKEGAYYEWELEGITDLDDLYEFADSIQWVKSSDG